MQRTKPFPTVLIKYALLLLNCPQWNEFYITMKVKVPIKKKLLLQNQYLHPWLKYAAANMNQPNAFWRKVLWSDVTQMELFGRNQSRSMFGGVEVRLSKLRTLYQMSSILVGSLWVLKCYLKIQQKIQPTTNTETETEEKRSKLSRASWDHDTSPL